MENSKTERSRLEIDFQIAGLNLEAVGLEEMERARISAQIMVLRGKKTSDYYEPIIDTERSRRIYEAAIAAEDWLANKKHPHLFFVP